MAAGVATVPVMLESSLRDLRHAARGLAAKPTYTAVSVTLDTKSTWKALIQFLHGLQGPDQFIVLDSAELKVDTTDQTQMRGKFRISKWFAPKS